MQEIYPINESNCNQYVGQHVCAVLHDGSAVHGCLCEVSGGHLHFESGYAGLSNISTTSSKKAKAQLKNAKDKASVSFFPFLGARFALGFAAIATLFLLPFFFFI
ncbi:hypothetical protein [Chengkuizengella sediminis]|uniref:hypothetical protein n=1 Tax=Chengkuizengella sediminis TaxID=1885917 RepID=UPI00138A25FC|nr:hypothetical protein [Chengkuizengella sediminis]NDI34747.1 hypothetical protein [Chengkuizengella sediminis]